MSDKQNEAPETVTLYEEHWNDIPRGHIPKGPFRYVREDLVKEKDKRIAELEADALSDDYSLCDCCESYSTDCADDDGEGNPLGHVQCGNCSRIAALEAENTQQASRLGAVQAECDTLKNRLNTDSQAFQIECHKKEIAMLRAGLDQCQSLLDVRESLLRRFSELSDHGTTAIPGCCSRTMCGDI